MGLLDGKGNALSKDLAGETGNKQMLSLRGKTESLYLIKWCCMAYLILIKLSFKYNSEKTLIHNLLSVFYKKAEKCFSISRLFLSIV